MRTSRIASSLAKPLRLAFRQSAPAVVAATTPAAEDAAAEVEFVAYAEDCILSGQVQLSADRLSDLVNEHEEIELIDVLVADLTGGQAVEVRQLLIRRDEILVLHATGPRGRTDRRHRTRQHPIAAKLGPYLVRGYIHALPGSDPIAGLRHRKPIIALTDVVIEYSVGNEAIRRRVSTVLINRELADWIVDGDEGVDELAQFEMSVDGTGLLLKDFTGDVLGWAGARDGEPVSPAVSAPTAPMAPAASTAPTDSEVEAGVGTLDDVAGAA